MKQELLNVPLLDGHALAIAVRYRTRRFEYVQTAATVIEKLGGLASASAIDSASLQCLGLGN